MPEWQHQLESLLAALHVSLADGQSSTMESAGASSPDVELVAASATPPSVVRPELDDDVSETDGAAAHDDEVSAVRSEIEATVLRVAGLVRAGRMDRATRDDVIFVLQALTRPLHAPSYPLGLSENTGELRREWDLTSAAAVLRFCRIVLKLTHAVSHDGLA